MKRIFIAIQYMELGGAERALLGLLDALDASRFQVDLFVYRHSGELMPLIPDKVNLLPCAVPSGKGHPEGREAGHCRRAPVGQAAFRPFWKTAGRP